FAKRDNAFGEVHSDVADALEVIGDFQRSHDEAHLVVGKRTAAEQANGVFVDDYFHFVDARLKEENFSGQTGGAGIVEADDGIQGAVHGTFHSAGHGNQIVNQCVVKNCFGKAGGARHVSPLGAEAGTAHSRS